MIKTNSSILNLIKSDLFVSKFKMAYSRFEYVRENEKYNEKSLLPDCYIVVRIDGTKFHHFSDVHNYLKPNDKRALDLMNASAIHVIKELFPHIILSYGQSDEYSFIFSKESKVYFRRQNKLTSIVASLFTSAFVFNWNKYFNETKYNSKIELKYPPSFDSRCVLYSSDQEILDYLKWRQVDCYINNIYNTAFYALTGKYCKWLIDENNLYFAKSLDSNKYLSPKDAHECIKGTSTNQRVNDILKDKYNIIYDQELQQFQKGSLILIDQENCNLNKIKKEVKKKIQDFTNIVSVNIIHQEFVQSDLLEKNLTKINKIKWT